MKKKLGNFIFPKNHTIDSSSCGKNSTLAFLKLFLYSNFKNFGGHWKIFPHLIFSENMSFFGGTIDVCTRWVFEKKSWPTSNLKNFKLLSFLQISIFFGTDVKLFGYCNYTKFHNYLNLPKIPLFSQNYGYSGSIGSRTTTSAGTRFQHEAGGGRRPPRPSGGTLFQYEWELWNRLLPRPACFQHDTKLIKSSK